MNKALIAKIGWRLLHDVSSLWASVVRNKYKVGEASWLGKKSSWSSTWRSIGVGMQEVIVPGLSWVLGDGNTIKFWKDKWLGNVVLGDLAKCEILVAWENAKIRDLWIDDVGWDFTKIEQFVPSFICLNLRAVMVDSITGAKDRVAWGATTDGVFSVGSAYRNLTKDRVPRPNMELLLGHIWNAIIPERVRVFLWLVVSGVIMTNAERLRRHLSDSGVCQVCKGGIETIMHVLRDCPAISGVWNRIVSPAKRRNFFDQTRLGWLYTNLSDTSERDGTPWATTFGIVVWWGWKWRCDNVFSAGGRCRDRVRFVKDISCEVYQAHRKRHNNTVVVSREVRQITWVPPQTDWIKLNMDGASRGNPGLASAGGVMRDSEGRWIQGFVFNIGWCSATLAELWGVYYGLCLAWEKRIPKLELVVDSELVVNFLTTGICVTHPLSPLVHMCYGFLKKDWTVRISHEYREANRLVDALARYAFDQPLGVAIYDSCPISIISVLDDDARGSGLSRQVCV